MEATWGRSNPISSKLVLLLIAAAVAVSITMAIVTNTHALERHGASVIAAATNCFGNNPTLLHMTNPITKRNADICFDGSKYHVHITSEEGNPITTFAKEKMKDLGQVFRYMCNAGYVATGKPCPIQ